MDDDVKENKIVDFNEDVDPSFKELSLHSAIIMLLVMFNVDEYPKLLRLSTGWNFCIQEALDEYCSKY